MYVSFSGGKDSTVLLDLVRRIYPDVPAVYSDTGLEYPELRTFVKEYDNVEIVKPKMLFRDIVKQYGYPLISKEVAEAIYYARRLGGGAKNRRTKTSGTSRTTNVQTAFVKNKETARRRNDLMGHWQKNTPNSVGTESTDIGKDWNSQDNALSHKEETIMQEKKSKSKGVFSKFLFNKEKWLPLSKLPIPISHYCCNVMKKSPLAKYHTRTKREPYLGLMTDESRMRKQAWLKHGCNAFNSRKKSSQPMAFWTEQDVLEYIIKYNVKIAEPYGEICREKNGKLKCSGCSRTGCMFCGFGLHLEKGETRFQQLAKTHPEVYDYVMRGGEWADNPAYDPTAPKFDGEWENWNPKKIWVPTNNGLGMRQVFDMVNEVYGKDFYRY